jgi:2'-5' RNA ligase
MSEPPVGRLFVGIPLPAELREGLEAYLARVFGGRMPGRAVPPANWHLTLRFLGETHGFRYRPFLAALRALDAGPAFDLAFAGPGAFPRPARATVLWIGVDEGADRLRALAAKIEAAAVRAGFAPEEKAYSPHLTLSRIQPPADVRPAIEASPAFGGRMRVDEFVVFRSQLGGGPPRYERIASLPLG